MGDPAGVGPEITLKAWQALRTNANICFFVIGEVSYYPDALIIDHPQMAGSVFGKALPVLPIDTTGRKDKALGSGSLSPAEATIASIRQAVDLALAGKARGIVTNPIAKSVLYDVGFEHPGHTEFLAALCQNTPTPCTRGPVMMLSCDALKVALATIHIPLADVSAHLSQDLIMRTANTLHGALRTDFGIDKPRIAVAGVNPHAGEMGAIGKEEIDIINPAIARLRAEGIQISNAQSGDTLFHADARTQYDAVLAMYHDQGLIPVKTLDFYGGVNTTLGLPIIRTSPDHGTGFDIAGKGIARPDSLINAIQLAADMSAKRAEHVQP